MLIYYLFSLHEQNHDSEAIPIEKPVKDPHTLSTAPTSPL